MKKWISVSTLASVTWLAAASTSLAGVVGAPAPLLGAGLPGLAILAAAGAGYVALRMRRRDRD